MATQVFEERGYESGTVEDVAERLGVSKASIFYYIPSKDRLLYLIFIRGLDDAIADLDSRLAAGSKLSLEELIAYQVRLVTSRQEYFLVFYRERIRLASQYHGEVIDKERVYQRFFRSAITQAIVEGLLPPVDVRRATNYILGTINGLIHWRDPTRDDPEQIIQEIMQMFRLWLAETCDGSSTRLSRKSGHGTAKSTHGGRRLHPNDLNDQSGR